MITTRISKFTILAALVAGVALTSQSVWASYSAYVAGTSPVGWWGMNGTGSVTTPDLSGAYGAANNQAGVNLDQTYQAAGVTGGNILTGQAGYVSGVGNNSTYFDGSSLANAYAHATGPYSSALANAIYRYPSGFSVEVWAKSDGLAVEDSERFLGVREWGLGFESGGGSNPGSSFGRVHFTTFGKQDYFSTTLMPSDNGWHQIGVSWDGSTATFYIDGVNAGSQAGAVGLTGINNASPNNQLDLASRSSTSSQNFKGWLDEVVIWGTTRSDADFAASFAAAQAESAVPEPSTLLLLAMGGLSMFGVARRMRK